MLEDFKKFILGGNLIDLAIGFTVGAAFSTVAKSLVEDIIMPPVGLLTGGTDFSDQFIVLKSGSSVEPPYQTLADASAAGAVTLNYGQFVNNLLALLLVALAMFFIIRVINKVHDEILDHDADGSADKQASQKKCRFCKSVIDIGATRCPHCTSELLGGAEH